LKQTLLLVVLLFTAASAPCQTNTGVVPGDPTYQQQFDSESGNHQLHDIPPQQPPAQAGTGSSSASERWRYDPAVKPGSTAKRPFLESPIERALKGINPCNVPYGRLLDEWHAMLVRETIENVHFWALLTLIAGTMLSCSYSVWLLREREERTQVAGGIVAQLWNAHVFARGKALEATEAHKRLVEVNDEGRAARYRAAQQRAKASDASEPPSTESATEDRLEEASRPVRGEDDQQFHGLAFERTSTPNSDSSVDSGQDGEQSDAVPTPVKIARFAKAEGEGSSGELPLPEPPTDSGVAVEAISDPQKVPSESDAENTELRKLELQKAKETLAILTAQVATKDAQLQAKDDKIANQREVLNKLQSRIQDNRDTEGGAN
jgi:hypothetical protein